MRSSTGILPGKHTETEFGGGAAEALTATNAKIRINKQLILLIS